MFWFPLFNGSWPVGRDQRNTVSQRHKIPAVPVAISASPSPQSKIRLGTARTRPQPTNGVAWLRASILRWSKAT